jgi:hypothetical protein
VDGRIVDLPDMACWSRMIFFQLTMTPMTAKNQRLQSQPKMVTRRIVITLLVGFGLVIKTLYKLFFAWWLNPALNYWAQKSFANEIKQAFPFLFAQYKAKVVPSPRPGAQSPEMAYICIATVDLVFEFTRWRDENYAVTVSPTFAPKDSYELIDALRVVDLTGQTTDSPHVNGWSLFARLLEPRFPMLEAAFNQENFADTKEKFVQLRSSK